MKIEFILLLSALSLGCIACGGNKPEAETPAIEPPSPPASEPSAPSDTSETPEETPSEEPSETPESWASRLSARLGFGPILAARSERIEAAHAGASPDFVSHS